MSTKASGKEKIFLSESVWKAIFSLAIPSVISVLVIMLYHMADMFFVGQLGSNEQISAISIASPVFSLMMAFGTMFGGGGCAVIARTLGEGDEQRVRLYSCLCCWGIVCCGILFALAVHIGQGRILDMLGAKEDFREYTRAYIKILSLGAPAMIFSTSYGNILRATGSVKEAMFGNLLATITNLILDPLFIFVFRFGVTGVAIATVLGNLVGVVYFVIYIRRCVPCFSFSVKQAISGMKEIVSIISLGLPNSTSNVLTSVASSLANNMLVEYGTVAVAAMAASGKATTIISTIQMGICMGVQPLIAYHYGARNIHRVREILKKLAILTMSVGAITLVMCRIFSEEVVKLFLKDPEALEQGVQMVRLRVLTGPFVGLYYISTNFLQGSGNAKLATLTSLLRQGIFFIPLIYVMNMKFNVNGNIWAHIMADALAALVGLLLMRRQYHSFEAVNHSFFFD